MNHGVFFYDMMQGLACRKKFVFLEPAVGPVPVLFFCNTGKPQEAIKKYKCQICGHMYDPELGDPDRGIAPGTAFEDIPDNWTCPVCGAAKADFEVVDI